MAGQTGPKRLGYWLSEKKSKRISLPDIEEALRARNIEPVQIDLDQPLLDQGPFDGIIHKLTEYIALAELGDAEGLEIVSKFVEYASNNPKTIMLDPFDCLQSLMNRYKTYSNISDAIEEYRDLAFVPKFVALQFQDFTENLNVFRGSGVSFPAVCKPIISHTHGSNSAHLMTLIFNEAGLREATFPCVVQSFINHNAVLYKIYALGERYFLAERPSIKNFWNFQELNPIHFNGREVSKANYSSQLTLQSRCDATHTGKNEKPSPKSLNMIVKAVHRTMGLSLFGVDVVVEPSSGRLAIVDLNAFPGYDGVNDFPRRLAEFVSEELEKKDEADQETLNGMNSEAESNKE